MKRDINNIKIGTKVIYTSLDGRIFHGIVKSIESEIHFKVKWDEGGISTENIDLLEGITFPQENVAFEELETYKMLKDILGSI